MNVYELFPVGSRIRDEDGYRATVKYVGPVAAAKKKDEVYLGVEWDNQTRGKHDGSCVDEKGYLHRHFSCVDGAGSFIKPSKVSSGKSFIDALRDRYVSIDAPVLADNDTSLPDAFVSTLRGNHKSIEFVGEKNIRKWQQLSSVTRVALMNDNVSFVNSSNSEDCEQAAHLVEVDLQDNLLYKWEEVANLGLQLPNLAVLLLHGNKMLPLQDEVAQLFSRTCFQNLRVLALNNCNIQSWREVQILEPHLPAIEELLLSGNRFPDLPRADAERRYTNATGIVSEAVEIVSGFERLRVLDVSNSQLEEWSQVQAFGRLSSLQELVIDSNVFPRVEAAVDDTFVRLQRFSMSHTGLASWADIDRLATYPHLRMLRLSHIPLFAGKGASEVRPLVISRIKQLAIFNGSQIGLRERTDSERGYLRAIYAERSALMVQRGTTDPADSQVTAALLVTHPRYTELLELYAADIAPVSRAVSSGPSGALESGLVSVTLRNMSFKGNGSLEPLVKKLPKSLTVTRLKLMVTQLFGLENRLQQLSMRLYKDSFPFVLDDDESTIEYFGAIDGAEIFINEAKG